MNKKILSIILCIACILSMTIMANASWTTLTKVSFQSGKNYNTGAPNTTKQDDDKLYSAFYCEDRTSWSIPKIAVVLTDSSHTVKSAWVSLRNDSTIKALSTAEAGNVCNVCIDGSVNQLGTDTAKLKYDVDYK